jgi:FKBP-type peptidyl-prolyl cis-trans isomerase
MKNLLTITLLIFTLFACKSNEGDKAEKKLPIKSETRNPVGSSDSLIMDNGLKIHWLTRGAGDSVKYGDCVDIDYKVFLEGGKLVEGNHLLKKTFPFLVGFQMQTLGWDIAMKKLRVGDEVEVFIPSKLARGEKGIEGMIPPNSSNIVYLKIVEKRKPTRMVDGVKVWVFEKNTKNKVKFNRENTIIFHTMTGSPSNPRYFNSFRENQPFTMQMKDAGSVPGLKKALNNAKKADRMYVYIPSAEAYGSKGYLDVVKSNEDLFYNIYVMDVF